MFRGLFDAPGKHLGVILNSLECYRGVRASIRDLWRVILEVAFSSDIEPISKFGFEVDSFDDLLFFQGFNQKHFLEIAPRLGGTHGLEGSQRQAVVLQIQCVVRQMQSEVRMAAGAAAVGGGMGGEGIVSNLFHTPTPMPQTQGGESEVVASAAGPIFGKWSSGLECPNRTRHSNTQNYKHWKSNFDQTTPDHAHLRL